MAECKYVTMFNRICTYQSTTLSEYQIALMLKIVPNKQKIHQNSFIKRLLTV